MDALICSYPSKLRFICNEGSGCRCISGYGYGHEHKHKHEDEDEKHNLHEEQQQ